MKKRIFRWLLWFPTLPAYADLPEMEDPSRGQGDGIMETLQNYGYRNPAVTGCGRWAKR